MSWAQIKILYNWFLIKQWRFKYSVHVRNKIAVYSNNKSKLEFPWVGSNTFQIRDFLEKYVVEHDSPFADALRKAKK